jgi:GTP-binding protein
MEIRNIAIIAHVDHGKTTLVDELLKQSGAFRAGQAVAERAMDSNDIERERGITILAKATSVEWKGTRINIVDTPGHADFGGEVERILSMVDGVCLLVDAAEGPMPQTKFVTSKALALGLRPIVVLNKVDKPAAEPDRALNEVFDLFANLGADDDQLDFPILYASGINGWADTELDGPRQDMSALFDLIVAHVPPPAQVAHRDEPFRMLATTLSADPFLGRILTGRVEAGTCRVGETLKALSRTGERLEQFRVSKILAFRGLASTLSTRPRPAISSPSPACPRPPSPTRSARPRSRRRCPPSPSTRRRSASPSASTTAHSPGATDRRCKAASSATG